MRKIIIQLCLIYSLFLFKNNHKLNAQNLFSEIKESKITIDDKSYNSLSLKVSLPKKLVMKECLNYFKKFGEVNIDKKIVYHIMKSEKNSEQINVITSIENENKKTVMNTTSENYNNEEKMMSIKILLKGIRIVLQRKFYQDHIISLENKIKKYDRKQNRLIRQQPRLLEQNKRLFYKIYQKNKVNKYIFESSIEKMYLELDNYKKLIKALI
tara:strand:+ start:318 stop:953 length:636 start_codon:yes stop_codon:yes gene_type:complete